MISIDVPKRAFDGICRPVLETFNGGRNWNDQLPADGNDEIFRDRDLTDFGALVHAGAREHHIVLSRGPAGPCLIHCTAQRPRLGHDLRGNTSADAFVHYFPERKNTKEFEIQKATCSCTALRKHQRSRENRNLSTQVLSRIDFLVFRCRIPSTRHPGYSNLRRATSRSQTNPTKLIGHASFNVLTSQSSAICNRTSREFLTPALRHTLRKY